MDSLLISLIFSVSDPKNTQVGDLRNRDLLISLGTPTSEVDNVLIALDQAIGTILLEDETVEAVIESINKGFIDITPPGTQVTPQPEPNIITPEPRIPVESYVWTEGDPDGVRIHTNGGFIRFFYQGGGTTPVDTLLPDHPVILSMGYEDGGLVLREDPGDSLVPKTELIPSSFFEPAIDTVQIISPDGVENLQVSGTLSPLDGFESIPTGVIRDGVGLEITSSGTELVSGTEFIAIIPDDFGATETGLPGGIITPDPDNFGNEEDNGTVSVPRIVSVGFPRRSRVPEPPGGSVPGRNPRRSIPRLFRRNGISIIGCDCLRLSETSDYEASPGADRYEWKVTGPAQIIGSSSSQVVKVLGEGLGNVNLTLEASRNGASLFAAKAISVFDGKYELLVGGLTTVLPVHHPVPNVSVGSFEVQPNSIRFSDPENLELEAKVTLSGNLHCALGEIRGFSVQNGEHFEQKYSFDDVPLNGFNHRAFKVKDVLLKGKPDEQNVIRLFATNTIAKEGTDTVLTHLKLPEEDEQAILTLRAALKQQNDDDDKKVVKATQEALDKLLEEVLDRIEVVHELLERKDALDPGVAPDFTYQINDSPEFATALLKARPDQVRNRLKAESEFLLRPDDDPKQYFLIPKQYNGTFLKKEDGRLRHDLTKKVSVLYCSCFPINARSVSVKMNAPGFHSITSDQSITLTAIGSPGGPDDPKGKYSWEVLAHPKGAKFSFEPTAVTSKRNINFKTDTSGVYTFKVRYSFKGVTSPHTYDVGDAQIVIRPEIKGKVDRLETDNVPSDFDDFRDVPLYRERIGEVQPGAEIAIFNEKGALGSIFHLETFLNDIALENIKARLRFADDTEEDKSLFRSPENDQLASRTIRTLKEVKSILLFDIEYGRIVENPGDAVALNIKLLPDGYVVKDIAENGRNARLKVVTDAPKAVITTAGEGNSQLVVADRSVVSVPGGPGSVPGKVPEVEEAEEATTLELVNLILRNRDLGVGTATKALINEMGFPFTINLTNGNLNGSQLVFQMEGIGQTLSGALAYNSINARRERAVRKFIELNEKDLEETRKLFGFNRFGDGWSSSDFWHIARLLDREGEGDDLSYTQMLELECPDGNRILFSRQSEGEVYTVHHPNAAYGAGPGAVTSWSIGRTDKGYVLTDLLDWEVRFDKDGLITQVSNAIIKNSGGKLLPKRFVPGDGKIEVKDSTDRMVIFELGNSLEDQPFLSAIETPDESRWEYQVAAPKDGAVEWHVMTDAEEGAWVHEYDEEGMLRLYQPPVGAAMKLRYYEQAQFEGVPAEIAKTFWGRAGQVQVGDGNWICRYEARADVQLVEVEDPIKQLWAYNYETLRQACTSQTVKSNAFAESERVIEYDYVSDTKNVRKETGRYEDVTLYFYTGIDVPGGRSLKMSTVIYPDKEIQKFRYNSRGLLIRQISTIGVTTRLTYNDSFQVTEVSSNPYTTPGLPEGSKEPKLITITPGPEQFEYDPLGRLERHTKPDGLVYKLVYPEAIRGVSGLVAEKFTRRDFDLQTMTYDNMGRMITKKDVSGAIHERAYDKLGRLVTEFFPEIRTGTPGKFETNHMVRRHYLNGLGLPTGSEDFDGNKAKGIFTKGTGFRSSTIGYTARNVVDFKQDAEGNQESFEYDALLRVTAHSKPGQGTIRYREFDPFDRPGRIIHPEVGRAAKGHFTANLLDTTFSYDDEPNDEGLVSIAKKHGNIIKQSFYSRGKKLEREITSREGLNVILENFYNKSGQLITSQNLVGQPGKEQLQNLTEMEHNEVGMSIKQVNQDLIDPASVPVISHYGKGFDPKGIWEVSYTQDGVMGKRFNIEGIPEEILDSQGDVIERYVYDPRNRIVETFRPDPSVEDFSEIKLVRTELVERNGMGQEINNVVFKTDKDPLTEDEAYFGRNFYDVFNRVIQAEVKGRVYNIEYDRLDRMIRQSHEVEAFELLEQHVANLDKKAVRGPFKSTVSRVLRYDEAGREIHTIVGGSFEFTEYDAMGRPTKIERLGVSPSGPIQEQYFYDELGRLKTIDFGNDHVHHTTYNDKENRVVRKWEKDGLDEFSNVTQEEITLENETRRQVRDLKQNCVFETRKDGLARTISHGAIFDLNSIGDSQTDFGPNDFELKYEYKGTMRPDTMLVSPIGHRCEYFYDANGRLEFKSEKTTSHNPDQVIETAYRHNRAGIPVDLSGLASDGKRTGRFHQHLDLNFEGAPIRKVQTVGPDLGDLFVEEIVKRHPLNGSYEKVRNSTFPGLATVARESLGSGVADKINLSKSFLDPLIEARRGLERDVRVGFNRLEYDNNNRLISELKSKDDSERRTPGFSTAKRFYDANENLILEEGENVEGIFRRAYYYEAQATVKIESVNFPPKEETFPLINTQFMEFDKRGNQVGSIGVTESFFKPEESEKLLHLVQLQKTSVQYNAKEQQEHSVTFSVVEHEGKKRRQGHVFTSSRYYPNGRLLENKQAVLPDFSIPSEEDNGDDQTLVFFDLQPLDKLEDRPALNPGSLYDQVEDSRSFFLEVEKQKTDRYIFNGDSILAITDEKFELRQLFSLQGGYNQRLATYEVEPIPGLEDQKREVMSFNVNDLFGTTQQLGLLHTDDFTLESVVKRGGDIVNFRLGEINGRNREQDNRNIYGGIPASGIDNQLISPARRYNLDTGQFMSLDPLGFGAGNNLYRYAGNNPKMQFDPEGNAVITGSLLLGMAIGAGISAAFNISYQAYNKGWSGIDWGNVSINAAFGAISGGAGATIAKAGWSAFNSGVVGLIADGAISSIEETFMAKYEQRAYSVASVGINMIFGAGFEIGGYLAAKTWKSIWQGRAPGSVHHPDIISTRTDIGHHYAVPRSEGPSSFPLRRNPDSENLKSLLMSKQMLDDVNFKGDPAYDEILKVREQMDIFDLAIHGAEDGKLFFVTRGKQRFGISHNTDQTYLEVSDVVKHLKNSQFDPKRHTLRLLVCHAGNSGVAEQILKAFPKIKKPVLAATGELEIPNLIVSNTKGRKLSDIMESTNVNINTWVSVRWRSWYQQ